MIGAAHTTDAARASCPRCEWSGSRNTRNGIPAHSVVGPWTPHDARPKRARARCTGPLADREIARAIGAAFAVVGSLPPIDRRTLAQSGPAGSPGRREIYRSAPLWARYIVTAHGPLVADPFANVAHPSGRRTVTHYFADRCHAEAWGNLCALALGSPGMRAADHGYVTIGMLDRRMRRWSERDRRDCVLESPIAYTAIDPGGIVVRYTRPETYHGYGDIPPTSIWDRGEP